MGRNRRKFGKEKSKLRRRLIKQYGKQAKSKRKQI